MPYLISKGADINAQDHSGTTPLHTALTALTYHVGPFRKEAAKVLVAAGANCDAQDNKGKTCLGLAAGDVELVKLLIDNGATIRADALFAAIIGGHIETVKLFLDAGADANMRLPQPLQSAKPGNWDKPWSHMKTAPHEIFPLYAAAQRYRPNQQDKNDQNKVPESSQLMEALLAAGADPFAVFKTHDADYEHEKSLRLHDRSMRSLLFGDQPAIAEFKEVPVLHGLLEEDSIVHPILALASLDGNHRDGRGRTVLHIACHNRHGLNAAIDTSSKSDSNFSLPSYLDCLLARGADPLATDDEGRNVLHHVLIASAIGRNQADRGILSRLIKDYPVLVNQADIYGKTPLHLALAHALARCDDGLAQILLAADADPTAVDKNGNGALHFLPMRIHGSSTIRALFMSLLDRKLDINARNNHGETPIFFLNKLMGGFSYTEPQIKARSLSAEGLSLFENAGADLFAKDNEGKGLLHIAAKEASEPQTNRFAHLYLEDRNQVREKPTARFELLMKKGLDPMMEDNLKRTSLDIAAACGKEIILNLFIGKQ